MWLSIASPVIAVTQKEGHDATCTVRTVSLGFVLLSRPCIPDFWLGHDSGMGAIWTSCPRLQGLTIKDENYIGATWAEWERTRHLREEIVTLKRGHRPIWAAITVLTVCATVCMAGLTYLVVKSEPLGNKTTTIIHKKAPTGIYDK